MEQFFRNSTAIITGHTGFKGSWLSVWLHKLGARVIGMAIDPPTDPSHFRAAKINELVEGHDVDIKDIGAVRAIVEDVQPDYVFHLAAQSLVRQSYLDPVETYETNVFGTLNILEALRSIKKECSVVIVTSDKSYSNLEQARGYKETDNLGGKDPYSASKGAAELIIRSYAQTFFPQPNNIRISVGRAGNVIGGGDWATDRIVPDCVRSWSRNKAVHLRNSLATRPWQHVLDALSGYLVLSTKLQDQVKLHGEPFNFGPSSSQDHTVDDLIKEMSKHWNSIKWIDADNSSDQFQENVLLKLNCSKAKKILDWKNVLSFKETVQLTAEWYQSFYHHPDNIREVTNGQIANYVQLASKRGVNWAQ